jgi:hypothetical protein
MRLDIHVHHHFDDCGSDTEKVLGAISQLSKDMKSMGTKTQVAVDALVAEVTDSKGKLASLTTAVQGFPAVVAAAVADALAAANVDDATQAAAIEAATSEISDAVDAALAASEVNPEPAPEPPPPEEPIP